MGRESHSASQPSDHALNIPLGALPRPGESISRMLEPSLWDNSLESLPENVLMATRSREVFNGVRDNFMEVNGQAIGG